MFKIFRNVTYSRITAARQLQEQLAIARQHPTAARFMHTDKKKRFYKTVSVVQSNGFYEVNLDSRKLKTPSGQIFQVASEALAYSVANEWLSQKDVILLSQMHLTGLCNTSLDNPGRTDKQVLVDEILGFLETDTVLFYNCEPPELLEKQKQVWSPLIIWFNQRYGVNVEPTVDISAPLISERDVGRLRKHLMSYSWNAIQGITFGVDAAKSLILMCAVIDRQITVKEAVHLARLELSHQTDQWGVVEWAHDIELHDTTARIAAANLFVHYNSTSTSKREKNIQA